MNGIIINNMPVLVKEYGGQRVVTLKDIDTVHGRPDGTAGRNFRTNKAHFIKDEDYFTVELTTDEIRRQFGAGKNAGKKITLITETGYLMLVKSFTDELAWTVQRELVSSRFRYGQQTKRTRMQTTGKLLNEEQPKQRIRPLSAGDGLPALTMADRKEGEKV